MHIISIHWPCWPTDRTKILCARSRVFSPEPLFRFTFPIEIVRHRIQRSKFAGSKRLPDRLSGKCLAYYVIPPTLNRLFCLFFSTFSDSSFFFVRVLLLSSSNRQFFFSLSLSLSILFLFCDYTVVPSSWRFLAAGKKTWSTSFVRGFLSPSSARPIKGKVLAPGTRATLASPGTPGFGCVTLRSLFARLQEIPPTYSKISPQLNLHLKNLFLRALFFFRAWGTFRGISAVDREAIVSFN